MSTPASRYPRPADISCYVQVVAMHPHHGVEELWISPEWWYNIGTILSPYWINGYIITINCNPQ